MHFYPVIDAQNFILPTNTKITASEKDYHGSLLTLTEFLHFPSCATLHHTVDDRAVSDDATSDTKQEMEDFSSIQEMKAELNGVDVSDWKDPNKGTSSFGEVGLQPGTSCSACMKSSGQSPIPVKVPIADYITIQIECMGESYL